MLVFIVGYTLSESRFDFYLVLAIAFVLGVLIIIPIGGADMPVVVSMLNSYSGWAAAGIGFSLNNAMLIIAGSLVGSSGAILSYIMCKAMNRSFFNVILGGFGGEAGGPAAGKAEQRPVKSGSADDAAFVLGNAETVVIVPGYGLAVARAQHAVKELATKLIEKGITVKYAIHPVAGRMPGHMNVLLAEAEVPYDQVFEMEDINGELGQVDVAVILGANDVVNPAAHTKGSPIYGMPIIEAYKAKTIIVNKRSMAAGDAGPTRAVRHGEDDDGLRRREEGGRGHGQGDGTARRASRVERERRESAAEHAADPLVVDRRQMAGIGDRSKRASRDGRRIAAWSATRGDPTCCRRPGSAPPTLAESPCESGGAHGESPVALAACASWSPSRRPARRARRERRAPVAASAPACSGIKRLDPPASTWRCRRAGRRAAAGA